MNMRTTYIITSVIIIALIAALIAWALFIGRQQQELQQQTQDLGVFDTGSGGVRGGFFGGAFGESDSEDAPSGEGAAETLRPVLRQLYALPFAGFDIADNRVQFVDRATGHVFEKPLTDGEVRRIEQTTVPRVYRAYLVENGKGVIRQYLNEAREIITVYSNLSEETESGFVPGVTALAVSPDTTRVAYLRTTSDGSALHVAAASLSEPEVVWTSNLRDWHVAWVQNDTLLISQKASSHAPSSAYLFDLSTNVAELIVRQVYGLEVIAHPDGNTVLYSSTKGSTPTLFALSKEGGEARELSVATFAHWCIWTEFERPTALCAAPNSYPEAQYPDDLYRGEVLLRTALWVIDIENNIVSEVFAPESATGVPIQMNDMAFNRTEDILVFKNAFDQTLWSLTFPQTPDEAFEEATP